MAKQIKKSNPNDFEAIIVNGCLIEPNMVYEVVPKTPSVNAPDVYRELDSIKERVPGVGNTVSLSQGDTGFFEDSPSFSNNPIAKNDWNKRIELSQKYFEVFALPMKIYIPEIERLKVPTDDEFFDKLYNSPSGLLTVSLGEGVQFNTNNPLDRFKLYIAIQEGQLSMKGKREADEKEQGLRDENDVLNQDAQYSYVSVTSRKNKKEQEAEKLMETSYKYGDLIRKNKSVLVGMLNYINIPVKHDPTIPELSSIYKTKIENSRTKLEEFRLLVERYEAMPEQLKLEFELLDKIRSKRGRELIKKEGSSYYFRDHVLGANYKSVVSALMKPENDEILRDFEVTYEF